MTRLLQTTIAGSLPKPAWLAQPKALWAPWRLEGEGLAEGIADAVRLAVADQVEAGIDIEEYSPTEVKSAVTGMGNADKAQVRHALERVHGFRDLPTKPDAVDAAAIALTHLMGARLKAAARAGGAR